jgi:hypothetical protein
MSRCARPRHNRGVRTGHARWRLVGRRLGRPGRKNRPGWLGRWPGTGPTRPIDSVPTAGARNHRPIPAAGPAAAGYAAQDQQPRQDMQRGEGRQQPRATQDQGTTGGAGAQLTIEQRTQVRQTILQSGNVPRVSRSDVDININVGTVVPRTVRLVTVPQKIVEIRPAWRGFRYFVIEDEVVIVEPSSLKIVAVIPA